MKELGAVKNCVTLDSVCAYSLFDMMITLIRIFFITLKFKLKLKKQGEIRYVPMRCSQSKYPFLFSVLAKMDLLRPSPIINYLLTN